MSDMKLIMEGWRYQTGKTDFNVLCESFDRGWISEEVLMETWHRRVLTEADELLTEDLMSILKQGWEKGKELAGKAKEVYDAAVAKVNEFFLKLCYQVWALIQKIKETLAPIARALGTIYGKVKKFCSAHPVICRVIKYVLIILAVAAVAYFAYNVLQQTQTPDAVGLCEVCLTTGADGETYRITDSGIDAMKGFLGDVSQAKDADPEYQQALVNAFSYVEECSTSTDTMQLGEAAGKAGNILSSVSDQLREVVAREDSVLYDYWVKLGKKVYVQLNQATERVNIQGDVTVKTIRWQSLKAPGHL